MRFIYNVKFGMLQVRENVIALHKLSGGTTQLRTLEGTLMIVNDLEKSRKLIEQWCSTGMGMRAKVFHIL